MQRRLRAMSHCSTAPNTVTCNTVLSAFDVAGKWSLAADLAASSRLVGLDLLSFNTAAKKHLDTLQMAA